MVDLNQLIGDKATKSLTSWRKPSTYHFASWQYYMWMS